MLDTAQEARLTTNRNVTVADEVEHPPKFLDLDRLVIQLINAMIRTGAYELEPNDDRLLNEARIHLLHHLTTVTTAEITDAIDKWVKLNDSLVDY